MSMVLVVRRMWKWTKSICSLPSIGASTFCTVRPALMNSVGGQTMHAETSMYAKVNNIPSGSIRAVIHSHRNTVKHKKT